MLWALAAAGPIANAAPPSSWRPVNDASRVSLNRASRVAAGDAGHRSQRPQLTLNWRPLRSSETRAATATPSPKQRPGGKYPVLQAQAIEELPVGQQDDLELPPLRKKSAVDPFDDLSNPGEPRGSTDDFDKTLRRGVRESPVADPLDQEPLSEPAPLKAPMRKPSENPPSDAPAKGRDPFEFTEPKSTAPLPHERTPRPGSSAKSDADEFQTDCDEEIAKLRTDTLASWSKEKLSLSLAGTPGSDYPYECSFNPKEFEPRLWAATTFEWKASALCHKPLYFEDEHLERYGHEWGPFAQPVVSGAHFFATLPILPYKMGLRTPNECVYALGYYRPGDCAPYMINPVPFTWRAALYESAAWVSAAYIIP